MGAQGGAEGRGAARWGVRYAYACIVGAQHGWVLQYIGAAAHPHGSTTVQKYTDPSIQQVTGTEWHL